jgi:hypothetical protein
LLVASGSSAAHGEAPRVLAVDVAGGGGSVELAMDSYPQALSVFPGGRILAIGYQTMPPVDRPMPA